MTSVELLSNCGITIGIEFYEESCDCVEAGCQWNVLRQDPKTQTIV